MKAIILIIMILTSFNALSQDTVIDGRSQLELIADELDISEREAYDSLVAEQRVQASRNLMIFVTMFLSMYSMRRIFKSKKLNLDEDGDQSKVYLAYYEAQKAHDDAYTQGTLKDKGDHYYFSKPEILQSPEELVGEEKTDISIRSSKNLIYLIISLVVFA